MRLLSQSSCFSSATISVAVFIALTASSLQASADSGVRHYQFIGHEGGLRGEPIGRSLFGNFSLDLNATGVTNHWGPGDQGTTVVFSSAVQWLSGQLGTMTFSGIGDLHVSDGPEWWAPGERNDAKDHWILRIPVTGPTVDDLTPAHLNLFYYTSPAGISEISITPPHDPLTSPNEDDMQWNLSCLDVDGVEVASPFVGRLLVIESIPEPSAFTFVLMGVILLACGRRCVASRQR